MVKSRNSDSTPNPNSQNSDSKNRITADEKANESIDLGFEDAICPICLDRPHNSVMLECTSAGCQPYVCNTSTRHSNCLDQFLRSSGPSPSTCHIIDPSPVCPLCRGKILGWLVNKKARAAMDVKSRECSYAGCDFAGPYADLRKHARESHAAPSPWDVDQSRLRAWEVIERHHELATLVFSDDEEALFARESESLSSPSSRSLAPVWPSPVRSLDLNAAPMNDGEALSVSSVHGWNGATWERVSAESNTGMWSRRNGMVSDGPVTFSHWPPQSSSLFGSRSDSNDDCFLYSHNSYLARSRSRSH